MTKSRLRALVFSVMPIAAILAACTEPKVPTTVTVSDSVVAFTSLTATRKLTASVFDQKSKPLQYAVTWTSSNPAVVSVTSMGDTGVVTAVGNGTAQVTATAGSASHSVGATVAQVPTAIVKVSGDTQIGVVAQALSKPLTAQVNDALGSGIPNFALSFTVTAGNGTISATSASTGSNGQASTSLTLGKTAGVHQVSASLIGTVIAPATFTATANAGPPASVVAPTSSAPFGTVVRGQVSRTLPVSMVAQVVDQYGNGVAGSAVTFAVTAGGGSVGTSSTTSAADGTARTTWTLGPTAGTQTMQASVPGTSALTFTATAVNSPFFIDLRFLTTATAAQFQAFSAAAARWEGIVTADLPDIDFGPFPAAAGQCGSNSPAITEVVDDVMIFVTLGPIDGPGGILGQSSPCYIRTAGGLTVVGLMQFDTADLALLESNGQLSTVVLHEMAHVLGFGVLWSLSGFFNCLQNPSAAGSAQDTYFSCPKARAVFDSIGGTSYTGGNKVPVENCGPQSPVGCGSGTFNSHWREPVFVEEIMTGYINIGIPNPLSKLTIASLEDLGYAVDRTKADPYTHTFSLPAGAAASARLDLGDDIRRAPIYAVDTNGRVLRVVQPAGP